MSREEWDRAYKMAWQRYYTIEHVETVLRRVAVTKANASNALFLITWFMGSINIEHIHPLEGGFLRRKCAPRPAAGLADRAGVVVLSEIFRRGGRQAGAVGGALLPAPPHLSAHQERPASAMAIPISP